MPVNGLFEVSDFLRGDCRGPRCRGAAAGHLRPEIKKLVLDALHQLVMSAGRASARTIPSTVFSSSTEPQTSTWAASFGTRKPPGRPVSPVSPIRV